MIDIIDYGPGNPMAVANMLRRVGAEIEISSDPVLVARADRLVLFGIGAFDVGVTPLESTGLIPLLRSRVLSDGIPVIGLCLGMQQLTESSEDVQRSGLGWIRGAHFDQLVSSVKTLRPPVQRPPVYGHTGASARCVDLLATHGASEAL